MHTISRQSWWRAGALALCTTALLAQPLVASALEFDDPIITPPTEPETKPGGGGNTGGDHSGGGNPTPPPSGSSNQGQLTDATGNAVTVTRDNKSLQFQSAPARQGVDLEYNAGIDSSEGGGATGGFPYWEGNGDWMVTKSARCEVAGRGSMRKIAGTKKQSFSCYVDWMDGRRQYVDLANCQAGANNTKADEGGETKRYMPPSCPHPAWNIGSWRSWSNTSGWYRRASDRGKRCGTIVEYRNQRRTRSLSCSGGTYNECRTYNGPVQTAQTRRVSRNRWLGSCSETRYDSGSYFYTYFREGEPHCGRSPRHTIRVYWKGNIVPLSRCDNISGKLTCWGGGAKYVRGGLRSRITGDSICYGRSSNAPMYILDHRREKYIVTRHP